jgi:hypothetical protein
VWSAEKRVVQSLAFVATSSLLPEGRVVYMNDKSELVCLEKKLDKKTENKTGNNTHNTRALSCLCFSFLMVRAAHLRCVREQTRGRCR